MWARLRVTSPGRRAQVVEGDRCFSPSARWGSSKRPNLNAPFQQAARPPGQPRPLSMSEQVPGLHRCRGLIASCGSGPRTGTWHKWASPVVTSRTGIGQLGERCERGSTGGRRSSVNQVYREWAVPVEDWRGTPAMHAPLAMRLRTSACQDAPKRFEYGISPWTSGRFHGWIRQPGCQCGAAAASITGMLGNPVGRSPRRASEHRSSKRHARRWPDPFCCDDRRKPTSGTTRTAPPWRRRPGRKCTDSTENSRLRRNWFRQDDLRCPFERCDRDSLAQRRRPDMESRMGARIR